MYARRKWDKTHKHRLGNSSISMIFYILRNYVERDSPFIISRDGMISYHIQDEDNPIIRSILKYKEEDIRPTRFTTFNMADATKYLFEPIEDEPYDDYFIGENPHSWV